MDTLSKDPVFVFLYYVSRSGSTFLLNELSKAKGVLTCPEGDILIDVFLNGKSKNQTVTVNHWQYISKKLSKDEKLKTWRLDLKKLGQQIIGKKFKDAFFQTLVCYAEVQKEKPDFIIYKSTILVNEKLPLIDFIENRTIRIISLIRDCRGVYASQKKFKLFPSGHFMANNPITVSYKWKNHYQTSHRCVHKEFFSIFLYEELISNFDYVIKRIYQFIGLPLCVKDLLHEGTHKMKIPAQQLDFHNKIGLPPLTDSLNAGTKELSKQEIKIIEYINGNELKKLGFILTDEIATLNFHTLIFLFRHIKHLLKRVFLNQIKF